MVQTKSRALRRISSRLAACAEKRRSRVIIRWNSSSLAALSRSGTWGSLAPNVSATADPFSAVQCSGADGTAGGKPDDGQIPGPGLTSEI